MDAGAKIHDETEDAVITTQSLCCDCFLALFTFHGQESNATKLAINGAAPTVAAEKAALPSDP